MPPPSRRIDADIAFPASIPPPTEETPLDSDLNSAAGPNEFDDVPTPPAPEG